jgi:hypothetical protein
MIAIQAGYLFGDVSTVRSNARPLPVGTGSRGDRVPDIRRFALLVLWPTSHLGDPGAGVAAIRMAQTFGRGSYLPRGVISEALLQALF